jgi:hypothetical protein
MNEETTERRDDENRKESVSGPLFGMRSGGAVSRVAVVKIM